jgi:NAD(P)-dependent dehydrogenase (short-subunit alcohol dehydrogenase family)
MAAAPRCGSSTSHSSPRRRTSIDELADALGGIDVLVNNSGTSRQGKVLELDYDDWRHTLSVDLDGAFLCAQRAARRMVEQGRGGRIVNVTARSRRR